MSQTFAQQLHAFALAVDIVSDGVFKRVLEAVTDYLQREVKIRFFEVLVATDIGRENPRRGLRSEWHPGGKDWSETLRDEQGHYHGQVSYAFDKRVELWVVARDRGTLESATAFENLLRSHVLAADFPLFKDLTASETRTSIMWPMRIGSEFIGLINLESPQLLKPTEILKREIATIAESIGHLYVLHQTALIQGDNTRRAIKTLAEASATQLPHKRRAFIASPARADAEVVAIIRKVVQSTEVEEVFWGDDDQSGTITDHIWNNISTSEIGICYLSEPSPSDDHGFRDNQNVLFEAGMMHALTHSARVMRAWIPVREKDSAEAPFDYSTERMLFVPRLRDGSLNAGEFERAFRKRITHLLAETSS